MSNAFAPALNLVLDALKTRRVSGSVLTASVASLERLHKTVALQAPAARKTLRVAEKAPEPARSTRLEEPRAGGRTAFEPVPQASTAQQAEPPAKPAPPVKRTVSSLSTEEKVSQLAALRAEAAACVRCPNLVLSRSSVVFGEGNPDAELMLVGEAPGADEDMQGKPFVGAAGQLLEKMFQAMGLSRDQVYIANILKCRPDLPPGASGNRKPSADEMGRCLPYLKRQIEIVQPQVIVALGATAMQGLFARTEPMARLRSQWYSFEGIPVMATYHPSYLLHNQGLSERRKVWEDLLQVMDRLGYPISAKQRAFFTKGA